MLPTAVRSLFRPVTGNLRRATPIALALLLAACTAGPHADSGQASGVADNGTTATFTSRAWGISIRYPANAFRVTSDFSRSYLQNGVWKTYAGVHSKGQAVVALVLNGSNDVTDAELRIGASRDVQAVRSCTVAPGAVRGKPGRAALDGVQFTTFTAGDAAMSHYLLVHAYRAVHDGACYAIDLLVYGTNPQVYSPPRVPPFSHAEAFSRLEAALRGLRFTRR